MDTKLIYYFIFVYFLNSYSTDALVKISRRENCSNTGNLLKRHFSKRKLLKALKHACMLPLCSVRDVQSPANMGQLLFLYCSCFCYSCCCCCYWSWQRADASLSPSLLLLVVQLILSLLLSLRKKSEEPTDATRKSVRERACDCMSVLYRVMYVRTNIYIIHICVRARARICVCVGVHTNIINFEYLRC